MNPILILLLVDFLLLVGLRYLPKPTRYLLARWLRKYANWVSPDNF